MLIFRIFVGPWHAKRSAFFLTLYTRWLAGKLRFQQDLSHSSCHQLLQVYWAMFETIKILDLLLQVRVPFAEKLFLRWLVSTLLLAEYERTPSTSYRYSCQVGWRSLKEAISEWHWSGWLGPFLGNRTQHIDRGVFGEYFNISLKRQTACLTASSPIYWTWWTWYSQWLLHGWWVFSTAWRPGLCN